MMESLKIVVIGPPHAGTTTFIHSVSEISVLSTERRVGAPSGPDTGVIALDFGRVTAKDDIALYLFGISARDQAVFPWETLSEGALGVVILGDATSETSLQGVRALAESFTETSDVPFVVALTMWRDPDRDTMERTRSRISIAEDVPLLVCSPRDRVSVRNVLLALTARALETMPATQGATS